MSAQSEVSTILRKLADDVQFNRYGRDDDMDAAAFWEDWDEAQDSIAMYLPDPNAE